MKKHKILTAFNSPRFGNCKPGDLLLLSDEMAVQFADHGYIEISEEKAIETKPHTTEKKKTKKVK